MCDHGRTITHMQIPRFHTQVWYKELCWISGHSYQIIESSFSQKFYYPSFRDHLKEVPQWVNGVVLITALLQHCTFQEYVLNCQSLATMLASSWWSSGQDMGCCGPGMAKLRDAKSSGQYQRSRRVVHYMRETQRYKIKNDVDDKSSKDAKIESASVCQSKRQINGLQRQVSQLESIFLTAHCRKDEGKERS